jgi:hypothetical protein
VRASAHLTGCTKNERNERMKDLRVLSEFYGTRKAHTNPAQVWYLTRTFIGCNTEQKKGFIGL